MLPQVKIETQNPESESYIADNVYDPNRQCVQRLFSCALTVGHVGRSWRALESTCETGETRCHEGVGWGA